jgi:prohibitin 1
MNAIEGMMNKLAAVGGMLFFGSLFFNKMLYFVDGGQRALVFDRFKGVKPEINGEGIHFVIPGI